MPDFTENAYAKINLTLDITGKLPNGYHTIRSVFQSITLSDRVSLTETSDGEIHLSGRVKELPCGKENTVYRAAEAFFQATGLKNPGVSFFLEKRIPWQAGLGGGSADAAAALRLLNRTCHTALSEAELSEIGLTVGADVPFCLLNGTALAEGIGEKLTRLPPLPPCRIVVCKPEAGIGTKQAYEALDRSGIFFDCDTDRMLEALRRGDFSEIAAQTGNAFEKTVPLPEIKKIKRRMLEAGAAAACMSGTGSAVFGLFDRQDREKSCADDLRQIYPNVFVCKPFFPD
ncbi:4-(cytidine 5'-diphospho)-2-C-methyl-D-erythritol kinase [Caproicibacter sp.]|uniref:4-(cytidine 5'-diphospho)-2-C-methyl-D-erythritol kinase n=1 Tax=Caproicibacter sp. TaxID=2814884 RepID=UPI003989745C